MRINRYISSNTNISRRKADELIKASRVKINDQIANLGSDVNPDSDRVYLDSVIIHHSKKTILIMLNKPENIVVSRDGQGSKTVYDILPFDFKNLKPVGRLDKNSSGLILFTNNGKLINDLTHPSSKKKKIYLVKININLIPADQIKINNDGVMLEDGLSKLNITQVMKDNKRLWKIIMTEGRNRQIRRTFDALGYKVISLHRISFDKYELGKLEPGKIKILTD